MQSAEKLHFEYLQRSFSKYFSTHKSMLVSKYHIFIQQKKPLAKFFYQVFVDQLQIKEGLEKSAI